LSRSGEDAILLRLYGMRTARLYSRDLQTAIEIPYPLAVSVSGETVATSIEANHWAIARIVGMQLKHVQNISGYLESLSDDEVIIGEGKKARKKSMKGKKREIFRANPSKKGGHAVKIAGKNRLYFSECSRARIVDLNGNKLDRLPNGWGLPQGSSADGTR